MYNEKSYPYCSDLYGTIHQNTNGLIAKFVHRHQIFYFALASAEVHFVSNYISTTETLQTEFTLNKEIGIGIIKNNTHVVRERSLRDIDKQNMIIHEP